MKDALELDLEAKSAELSGALREAVLHRLHKRGLVVAVSGGIDSACVAALGARALGPERVFALLLPEKESSPESFAYGKALCEKLLISYEVKDIRAARDQLKALGKRILGDGEPKIGAHGTPVLFLHPKDFGGTLIEIEEVA